MNLLDLEDIYRWNERSDGHKNSRGNKRKRITDAEYLERIARKDNTKALNEIGSQFQSIDFLEH
jgi:hypothetical protein